jgi:hypothetical protein
MVRAARGRRRWSVHHVVGCRGFQAGPAHHQGPPEDPGGRPPRPLVDCRLTRLHVLLLALNLTVPAAALCHLWYNGTQTVDTSKLACTLVRVGKTYEVAGAAHHDRRHRSVGKVSISVGGQLEL